MMRNITNYINEQLISEMKDDKIGFPGAVRLFKKFESDMKAGDEEIAELCYCRAVYLKAMLNAELQGTTQIFSDTYAVDDEVKEWFKKYGVTDSAGEDAATKCWNRLCRMNNERSWNETVNELKAFLTNDGKPFAYAKEVVTFKSKHGGKTMLQILTSGEF
jgi:hypothetical protein